jgi:hypothetical protein
MRGAVFWLEDKTAFMKILMRAYKNIGRLEKRK